MGYNTLIYNLIADDEDDEDGKDYSHRRNLGYCAKCGGICQYDDDGELIEESDTDIGDDEGDDFYLD